VTTGIERKLRADLEQQGGVLGALVELAAQIREAATTVAGFVESVALEVDRERRGSLSAVARHDTVELSSTILALLRDPLFAPEGRRALHARLLRELAQSAPTERRRPGRGKHKLNRPRDGSARRPTPTP
jgi:hypothetical protein